MPVPDETRAPSTRPGPGPDGGAGAATSAARERLEYLVVRARRFLDRHGHRLWWLHSVYALALGLSVAVLARKGFDHARWLVASLAGVWLLLVAFFRYVGPRAQGFAAAPGARARFFAVTYALKNLYQGMLFFLLPFYVRSATFDHANAAFVVALGACAAVAALDIVFDRVVMRFRALASVFYAFTLFACLALAIPALLHRTRTLWTLLAAALVAVVASWPLNVPFARLRRPAWLALVVASGAAGVAAAYYARALVPPVPMYLARAAVGTALLPNGRLAMEVRSVDASVIRELVAVTDVAMPGGKGDRLAHVWRREGAVVHRATEAVARMRSPAGTLRLRSRLDGPRLPPRLGGRWSVDVETEDGQLVGRTSFVVTE